MVAKRDVAKVASWAVVRVVVMDDLMVESKVVLKDAKSVGEMDVYLVD